MGVFKAAVQTRARFGSLVGRMSFRHRESVYALIATIPALVLYVLFTYYPLFQSVIYSFTDWNGYSQTYNNVGLDNFGIVFSDRQNVQAFTNTVYFAMVALTIGFPLQMLLAVLLHNRLRGRTVARVIIYMPALFSPVIVGLAWTALLQYTGVFNEFFRSVGLNGLVINWLGDAKIVMNAMVLINLWQYTGLGMVIFLTGLSAVPEEITESARLDGALGFTLFRHITFPLIMPSVTVNLLVGITGALRLFELPMIMTRGGPRNGSTTMVMTIYNNAFGYERFGVASSLGLVFFAVIACITLLQLYITRNREVQY
jgi:raffinose/stachyose/melibiose transport system permease protein